ncbi:MAG: carboxypeptidase-like regulatory domain-containing protein, partial [Thermoplasmata archaeon]|nr:carboxypeptidase-like regulatory domain-containing protein [Thermoplasmata archaeon]
MLRIDVPPAQCSYVYLAVTAGSGFTSLNFTSDASIGSASGPVDAVVGRSFNDEGSATETSVSPQLLTMVGIGVGVALGAGGQRVTTDLSNYVTLNLSGPAYVLLVAAGENASSASVDYNGLTTLGLWGWSGFLGVEASGILGAGSHSLGINWAPLAGKVTSFVEVYDAPISPMDWDRVAPKAGSALPSGVGGEGSRLAVDTSAGTALLFGGVGAQGLTGTTALWNLSNGSWSALPSTDPAPSPRANFTLFSDPALGVAVLFGGVVDLATDQCDNQTWIFYFANDTWSELPAAGAPPPREGAANAVDLNDSVGVLEGGSDPGYPLHGGVGSVLWNDTWSLNLTSHTWNQISRGFGPPPRTDAVMTYVPPDDAFLLYGGCARSCTTAGWALTGLFGTWAPWSGASGPIVPGAGGSAWVWDPTAGAAVLFGGYRLYSGVLVPDNETYAWFVANSTWSPVVPPGNGPSGRYGVASGFLGDPRCPSVLVLGGSTVAAGAAADLWALDENLLPEPNGTATPAVCGVEPRPTVPNPPFFGNLSVHVRGLAGLSLPSATVWLTNGTGLIAQSRSGPTGWANFTHVAPGRTWVNGSLAGYLNNTTVATVLSGSTVRCDLTLVRSGGLLVNVAGVSYLGLVHYALGGAFVQVGTPGRPAASVSTFTDLGGAASLTLPAGRHTLYVSAYGFVSNVPLPPSPITQLVLVPEAAIRAVSVLLQPLPGPDVTVTVLDVHTLRPIPGANLTLSLSVIDGPLYDLGLWHAGLAGTFVWFAVPPALYAIEASAPQYVTNSTSVTLHPNSPPVFLTIYLTPVVNLQVPCGSLFAPCTGGGTPGSGIDSPFGSRLAVGSPEFWVLALVPLLVLALIVA